MRKINLFNPITIAIAAIIAIGISVFAVNAENGGEDVTYTSSVTSISINSTSDGKVQFSWSGESQKGFKVVYSLNSGVEYPPESGVKSIYIGKTGSDGSETAYLDGFDGEGTYYVAVCEYLPNSSGAVCGTYSSETTINLAAKQKPGEKPPKENPVEGEVLTSSITALTLVADDEADTVSWDVSGENQAGVKLVYSMNANPTYPPRDKMDHVWYVNSDKTEANLAGPDGEGTYYVIVCEYLNTGEYCGTTSNEVSLTLAAKEMKPKCEFSDVDEDHKLCKHLKKAKEKGFVSPNENFNPESDVTRGQIVSMIVRAFDIEINTSGEEFADIVNDSGDQHTFYDEIMTLRNLGVVQGKDGNFYPDDPTTRGQATRILKKTIEALELEDFSDDITNAKEEIKALFADASIENHTFAEDIVALYNASGDLEERVMKGYSTGKFEPDQNVNRIEAVTFIDRALGFE